MRQRPARVRPRRMDSPRRGRCSRLAGMIEAAESLPGPALRPFVARLWHLRGAGARRIEPIFPDVGGADIALNLAEAGRLADGVTWLPQPPRLVVGGLEAPLLFEMAATTDLVGIRLPPGCACLLGVPAALLRGRALALEAVSPALDRALAGWMEARIAGEANLRDLAAVLAGCAGGCAHRCDTAARRAAAALAERAVPIEELAGALSLSARQLTRRFSRAVGATPGAFSRVARFARACSEIELSPPESWAAFAAEAGYCDQSHLIRDFRELGGDRPTRLFSPSWYASVRRHAAHGGDGDAMSG